MVSAGRTHKSVETPLVAHTDSCWNQSDSVGNWGVAGFTAHRHNTQAQWHWGYLHIKKSLLLTWEKWPWSLGCGCSHRSSCYSSKNIILDPKCLIHSCHPFSFIPYTQWRTIRPPRKRGTLRDRLKHLVRESLGSEEREFFLFSVSLISLRPWCYLRD